MKQLRLIPSDGPRRWYVPAMALSISLLIAGCSSNGDDNGQAEERATPVTVELARGETVREVQTTVGRVQSRSLPAISAETSGRVLEVIRDVGDRVEEDEVLMRLDDLNQQFAVRQADGAADRLKAMVANQERTVQRQRNLLAQNSISRSQFDATEAELSSLQAQLRETQARLEEAQLALEKTRVRSPVDGIIEDRMVSEGDFVSSGTPLYSLVGGTSLRIVLPYPERIAHRLEPGLTVFLSPSSNPDDRHEAQLSDLRPTIGTSSRSIDAIVNMENPGHWRSGASITGEVVLDERENSITVPENSLVRRPAGTVVYVIEDERASEQVVETGVRVNGRVEIRSGLSDGATVAVTGAQFLSDGGRVRVVEEENGDADDDAT